MIGQEPTAVKGLPRNMTRVRIDLPEPNWDDIDRAIRSAVKRAIGDPKAEVSWYWTSDEDDAVIVVEQAHTRWWCMMPSSITEAFGAPSVRATLRWRDDEPPEEWEH